MIRRTLLAVVRFFSPRRAQELEHAAKERSTRPAAYVNARQVAEAAGPWRMAHDLGIDPGLPLDSIAELAVVDYHPKAREAAKRGTREGFDRFLAGDVS
jgi:hypothetical protein